MLREEEIELVRKAKEGDTAAFGEIVRRYQNLVYATAFQIPRNPALAEKSFQMYRLPPDFAKRCICGCRRARAARTKPGERR